MVSNQWIYLLELVVLLIVLIVSNKKFQLKNFLNPYIIFLWFHIVFLYIGLFYDFLYENVNIHIDKTLKLLIIYSLLTSLIGALTSKILLERVTGKYKRIEEFFICEEPFSSYLLTAYIIFFLGFFLSLFFCVKLGGFIWLMGNFEDLRIEARKGMGYISVLSLTSVSYSSLYILLSDKPSYLVKIIIFLLSSFSLLSFGQRAPFLKWLILLWLLILIKKKVSFTLKKLIIYGILAYSLMVVLGTLRKGQTEEFLTTLLLRMPWRPFVNIYNLQLIFDNFPARIDYLLGYGYIIDLITLLPGYSPNLGTWIKNKIGLYFEGGSITITYIGDAYVNFGLLGAAIYPFLYGFLLNFIYMFISRHSKTSLKRIIFLSLLAISLGPSVNTGFMGPLLYNFLPIYFFYILHQVLSSIIGLGKKYYLQYS